MSLTEQPILDPEDQMFMREKTDNAGKDRSSLLLNVSSLLTTLLKPYLHPAVHRTQLVCRAKLRLHSKPFISKSNFNFSLINSMLWSHHLALGVAGTAVNSWPKS